MSQNTDTLILELLASKICHDLISPIGAVNNGVEILEEMGADAGDEVSGLIAFSAEIASAKLQAMRMAYGIGGSDASIKPESVHTIFESFISQDKNLTQDWDPHASIGPDILPTGFCKILMSCLLLTHECMPKGGIIRISKDDDGRTIIHAEGENTGFRENIVEAINLQIDQDALDPRLVHSYVTGMVIKNYNFSIETQDSGNGSISLILSSPSAA